MAVGREICRFRSDLGPTIVAYMVSRVTDEILTLIQHSGRWGGIRAEMGY